MYSTSVYIYDYICYIYIYMLYIYMLYIYMPYIYIYIYMLYIYIYIYILTFFQKVRLRLVKCDFPSRFYVQGILPFGSSMPPPLCNKCRETFAQEGDTWCVGCTGWEALGRELSGLWDVPGARLLANDFVLSCARQVRALRTLSAGLSRSAGSQACSPPSSAPPRRSRKL